MKDAILAIDQGTTSTRAIVFSLQGEVVSLAQKELQLTFPRPGWVEQNPQDILRDTLEVCNTAIAQSKNRDHQILAFGIANQRETTILWDRNSGLPVYNAIVWQDRRTSPYCEKLKESGHEAKIAAATGLIVDPYFSATKLSWILDQVEGCREKARSGKLAFGTVDSFLLWHLTGGPRGGVHQTDAANASRTMIFNLRKNQWDEELLELLDIPKAVLPEVQDNAFEFGETASGIFDRSYPIRGMAGDQHAALIGQACFNPGMVKSTYGTGCFALMNIGRDFKASENRLLTTLAFRLNGQSLFALEGSIFTAGAAVQWLRDGLRIISKAADSESLARSIDGNGGVYMVPAFTGLGAPHWKPEASALITGLRRDSSRAHFCRAALEAQAYQTYDLMSAMSGDCGKLPDVLRVDGGLVANQFVCQFLADILGIPVEVPVVAETTSWGAACLAALQTGVFKNLDEVTANWKAHKTYQPGMMSSERAELLSGWAGAVSKTILSK